jgi:small subunit ribosomal protein S1
MSESFAELFEESLKTIDMAPGSIITGVVLDIDSDWVTVHAGLKSEGVIPRSQFLDENGEFSLAVGDEVQVALEAVEDGFGETRLSREKARRAESWIELEHAHAVDEEVRGMINGKVKGGFTVDINGIRAFLPGSLVDVRPVRETTHLEGQVLDFKVIKLDQKRNNVVVSRRAVLEAANSADREALLANLEEGQTVKGIVKNLTDYGAFVDLGGVDGLLHITDMAWKRIKHPSEIVNVGDEIELKVLKFDKEKNRVSLGLKQQGEDPWVSITSRYPENSRVMAKVTNLTDYGCFAEIEEGVEGLVHVSEMDWTNKNVHPSKIVQVGDEVEVMVLDIDEERRRISLGIKQCKQNPWDAFGQQNSKGDRINGTIKSITDFGIFIGLDGNIDGLVHLSDISWQEAGEEAVRKYSKGDEIETVILAIDPERERISLGIKQLEDDPFSNYVGVNDKGSVVTGTVKEVDAKAAIITLAEDVEGVLKASEISRDKVEDARNALKEGDTVEAKIISVDRKNRAIALSVKSKDVDDEKEAVKQHREQEADAAAPSTIGDLIKAQMENQSADKDAE